jgi:hypothetical protein
MIFVGRPSMSGGFGRSFLSRLFSPVYYGGGYGGYRRSSGVNIIVDSCIVTIFCSDTFLFMKVCVFIR